MAGQAHKPWTPNLCQLLTGMGDQTLNEKPPCLPGPGSQIQVSGRKRQSASRPCCHLTWAPGSHTEKDFPWWTQEDDVTEGRVKTEQEGSGCMEVLRPLSPEWQVAASWCPEGKVPVEVEGDEYDETIFRKQGEGRGNLETEGGLEKEGMELKDTTHEPVDKRRGRRREEMEAAEVRK